MIFWNIKKISTYHNLSTFNQWYINTIFWFLKNSLFVFHFINACITILLNIKNKQKIIHKTYLNKDILPYNQKLVLKSNFKISIITLKLSPIPESYIFSLVPLFFAFPFVLILASSISLIITSSFKIKWINWYFQYFKLFQSYLR